MVLASAKTVPHFFYPHGTQIAWEGLREPPGLYGVV